MTRSAIRGGNAEEEIVEIDNGCAQRNSYSYLQNADEKINLCEFSSHLLTCSYYFVSKR
jgi:hypothetical protein